jgi:hypothetical protein
MSRRATVWEKCWFQRYAGWASTVVACVIFGLYPARKTAKLNHVGALRYEQNLLAKLIWLKNFFACN